ncbi:MAG: low specificity L-threonine aldolase [Gorillibacterium sp.]|nr:low specificity L-threonine aldolase [Gorillibacterium sp.]
MNTIKTLAEAFNQTTYSLTIHGKRNIQVLKDAFQEIEGDLASDMYGAGSVIDQFQNKMAKLLGKESAVFFPSGTMAQQIALRIWCDQLGLPRVAYHPLCHLEIHEQDGLKELHHIEPVLLADKDRVIQLDDVRNITGDIACLLLELPQREIGGQLPSFQELEAISAYCREQGIKLHLDGARLFEILPYYQKSAAEVCQLFDSVYISFYKGIGALAGAMLAGGEDFTKQSKVWKRRHGGDLISLYPYILSADYYAEQRLPRMQQYYEGAIELASLYNDCPAVTTLPVVPVSNMFHVHFSLPKAKVEPILISLYETTEVGLSGSLREDSETTTCSYEVSIGDRYAGIPKDKITNAFKKLDELLREAAL